MKELIRDYPSKSLAEALAKMEAEIEDHSDRRLKLTQELASEHIIDKQDFLNRLNLESYDGRYMANQQIRRLEIKVRMHKDEIRSQFVASVRLIPKFIFIWDHGQDMKFVPLSREALRASIRQGDMQSTAFVFSPKALLENAMAGEGMERFSANVPDSLAVTNFRVTPEAEAKAHAKLMEKFFGENGESESSS